MPNPGSGQAVAFAEDEGLRPVDGYFPELRFSLVSFMYTARISDKASFAVSIKIFSFVSLNQIITKRI